MGGHELSGLLPEGSLSGCFFSSSEYDGAWAKAEAKALDLLNRIQPSLPSEARRQAVSDYVQDLIYKYFECKVFPFGSVPLKTYLPDGDIDLTAFSWIPHSVDTWANDLRMVLEREEKNQEAKFCVKEVQIVHAEVQIVKCLVENIIVDISFNQLGGLCTLCFLDEVDRLIGRKHLFKRSIILVKAWCFYESRILGAHHGLVSTYALETLVLYIFHVFHTSLRGPLEVLYRFLEFFSVFNWDNFCLSLWGPIPLSSLPEMAGMMALCVSEEGLFLAVLAIEEGTSGFGYISVRGGALLVLTPLVSAAEEPIKNGSNFLLTPLFLDACSQAYGLENPTKAFPSKYMNIVDPLRINNNLGRSVSKGNFFRIRSAFIYGAKKLREMFSGPQEEIEKKLSAFFLNTEKHATAHRPDAILIPLSLNEVTISPPVEKLAASDLNDSLVLSSPNEDDSNLTDETGKDESELLTSSEESERKEELNGFYDGMMMLERERDNLENAKDLASDGTFNPLLNGRVLSLSEGCCYDAVAGGKKSFESNRGLDCCQQEEMIEVAEFKERIKSDMGILQTDSSTLLWNLKMGRHFQQALQRNMPWEGPGRPTATSFSAQVVGYGHGSLPWSPFHNTHLQHPLAHNNRLPKYQRGTGTYFPNPRPNLYQDRHFQGARNMYRGTNSFDGTCAYMPRYHSSGRGSNRFSTPEAKFRERLNHSTNPREEAMHRSHMYANGHTSDFINPGSGNKTFSSSKKNPELPSVSPPPIAITPCGPQRHLRPEELEFGSLGPAGFGNSAACNGSISQSSQNGDVLQPGEKGLRESSSRDALRRSASYELKEEDFPPLASSGQRC